MIAAPSPIPPSQPSRAAKGILWATCILWALATWGLTRAQVDLSPLAALPQKDATVQDFAALNQRFGVVETAQLLVESPNVFTFPFLRRLQDLTAALADIPDVVAVLSLTNVADVAPDPVAGGVITGPLVGTLVDDASHLAQLRTRVMEREAVAGSLVARDGHAIAIVCSLRPQADAAATAQRLETAAQGYFSSARIGTNGAPFVAAALRQSMMGSLKPLLPWIVVLPVLLAWALLRNLPIVAWTAMGSCGGTTAAAGAAAWAGMPWTPNSLVYVLIWLSLSSALSVAAAHGFLQSGARPQARSILWPGLAATAFLGAVAWCTHGGFGNVFAATLGAGICTFWVASILPGLSAIPVTRPAARLLSQRALPRLLFPVVMVGVVVGGVWMTRLRAQTDSTEKLLRGTSVATGKDILARHFRTAQTLLVAADGDFRSPIMLQHLQHLADDLAAEPGVTGVLGVGDALRTANFALEGLARLPDKPTTLGLLYFFLQSDPAAKRLITSDAAHAILYVQVASESQDILERLGRRVAAASGPYHPVAGSEPRGQKVMEQRLRARVLRAAALSGQSGVYQPESIIKLVELAIRGPAPAPDKASVVFDINQFLQSEESLAGSASRQLGAAIAHLGADVKASDLADVLRHWVHDPDPEPTVENLLLTLPGVLTTAWEIAQAKAWARWAAVQVSADPERAVFAIGLSLLDTAPTSVLVAGPGGPLSPPLAFRAVVLGEPIINQVAAAATLADWRKSLLAGCLFCLGLAIAVRHSDQWRLLLAPPCAALLIYGGLAAAKIELVPLSAEIFQAAFAALIVHGAVFYGHGPSRGSGSLHHGLILSGCFGVLAVFGINPMQQMGSVLILLFVAGGIVGWMFQSVPSWAQHSQEARPQAAGEQT